MKPIEVAAKLYSHKLKLLEKKYGIAKDDPDFNHSEILINESHLTQVKNAVAQLKRHKENEAEPQSHWVQIRDSILLLQARIEKQRVNLSDKNAFVLHHTQKTLMQAVNIAKEYIQIKDPDLTNPKSEKRIQFLAEQLLVQPARTSDVENKTRTYKDETSYYLQKSRPNIVMNSVMKIVRGLGKKNNNEQCTTVENIIPEPKKDQRQDIFYSLVNVTKRQPTFYTCGDTGSAMINHFQKLEVPELVAKLEKVRKHLETSKQNGQNGTESIERRLGAYLALLNQTSHGLDNSYHVPQDKSLLEGLRTEEEIKRLYFITQKLRGIDYKNANKDDANREAFAKNLAQYLYEAGPLMASINVGSPVNNHFVVINGVVGDKICYVDSWNGQNKEMKIEKFIDHMRDSDLSGILGYSYEIVKEINILEKDMYLLMKQKELDKENQADIGVGAMRK